MATQTPQSQTSPIVSCLNGHAVTTSIDVAAFFGKRHDNVTQSIKSLIPQLPDRLLTFQETVVERENPSGGTPIKSAAYSMTRDGFVLLAMGFTGKRALQFKIAYIEAFNRMEAQLRAQSLPPATITPAQQLELRKAIAKRAKKDGAAYQRIYHALYDRFQIATYDQLKATYFEEAIGFIESCDVAPKLGTSILPEGSFVVDAREARLMANFVYYHKYFYRPDFTLFLQFLRLVDSPKAAKFHDFITEINFTLLEKVLEKHGYSVKDMSSFKYIASH